MSSPASPSPSPSIQVRELTFRYRPHLPAVLHGVNLDLHPGERCLLVGANGAGKTTMLRVLAGQHMVPHRSVEVLGRPAFHDTSLAREVAFLGGRFPFDVDIPVSTVLARERPGDRALRAHLVELLGVDPRWSMRFLSDGQRRRVQILLGLLQQPQVLLLDEITTDLDVIARQDLLTWLRHQTEQRGAVILYATHILDALDDWATHVAWLRRGRLVCKRPLASLPAYRDLRERNVPSPLLRMVENWLRTEQREAREPEIPAPVAPSPERERGCG